MKPLDYMLMALDPSRILRHVGLVPDHWQREVLLSQQRQILLNCCRQAGKSTVASVLALHTALFQPRQLVLLLSPGQRQSSEIFRKVLDAYSAIGRPVPAVYETQHNVELANGSRILCLPGEEATIRGFSPNLLVIDEAARVPDDLYRSVRPMLAVSQGRLIALSTPFGQRGWYHDEWQGIGPWQRVQVGWRDCPRITPEFIQEERRALGENWVRQEYECAFASMTGLVYADFVECTGSQEGDANAKRGRERRVGGIDWGWRNPFAAVWGVLDENDVLWINEERYLTQTPLAEHVKALPRGVNWYCDPAGRTEMEEFRLAGHVIRPGLNNIRLGIAAVTARLRTGRLKIDPERCPNLLAEAKLYRYPTESERALLGENPKDDNNHALSALRYLVSWIDQARLVRRPVDKESPVSGTRAKKLVEREDLWTPL
jgi:Terminase large subunit, T4likevirus-type, N-terminal